MTRIILRGIGLTYLICLIFSMGSARADGAFKITALDPTTVSLRELGGPNIIQRDMPYVGIYGLFVGNTEIARALNTQSNMAGNRFHNCAQAIKRLIVTAQAESTKIAIDLDEFTAERSSATADTCWIQQHIAFAP